MSAPSGIVSVVIPVFNGEAYLRDAVESALGQTHAPLEVIVVDDGSTDGTAEVIRSFGARVRALRKDNGGVASARNAGIAAGTGEFIAILDADDVWHPRKLELQVRVMRDVPEIGVLGTGSDEWRGTREHRLLNAGTGGTVDDPRIEVLARERLAVRNYVAASSVMIRRSVAERVGGFDTALQGAADHDYWLRAAEVAGVARLAAPLTGVRPVAGSMSRQASAMERDVRRVLEKLDARDAWRGDRGLRRRAYSYADFSCAYMYGAAGESWTALARLVRSMAVYPLPYGAGEAGAAMARPRRLAVLMLRMLGVMRPDPGC